MTCRSGFVPLFFLFGTPMYTTGEVTALLL